MNELLGIQLNNATTDLLSKSLDIRSQRHLAIVTNVANQDTPEYKATDLNFKEALKGAAPNREFIPMMQTNGAHFSSLLTPSSVAKYPVEIKKDSTRLDGNSVNPEQEMAKLAENNLMYNATVQILSGRFNNLMSVIKEGR